jgi:SAM-dependent methyltransferase
MASPVSPDRSNGYEAVSKEFISGRTRSSVGVATVRQWAKALPRGAAVLDLGCGPGVPISQTLLDAGLAVHGIDASPSMIAAFRARFPNAPAECAAVEDSELFGRTFDGVTAWGLMFLLSPNAQHHLIQKVAAVLKPGGRFLFTSPHQVCEWADNLTRLKSVSLGSDAYRQIVEAAGLVLDDEAEDEGQNHYYFVRKPDLKESLSRRGTHA